MKYCPYCGTEITDSTVSFCLECGKKLEILQGTQTEKKKKMRLLKRITDRKAKTKENEPYEEQLDEQSNEQSNEQSEEQNDDYDGYYDDIAPQDSSMIQQSVDKDLIKRLSLLAVGFITVIGICIAVICLM